MTEGKGSCLCGAVKISVKNLSDSVEACHCGMCRRWGGGPFMVVDCGTDVVFEGKDNIAVYNSSDWAERGFCRQCGSHLFYRLKETNAHQLPVGLLDDQARFKLDLQVYIDRKPCFYRFADVTREMTQAQVIEKYAPGHNA